MIISGLCASDIRGSIHSGIVSKLRFNIDSPKKKYLSSEKIFLKISIENVSESMVTFYLHKNFFENISFLFKEEEQLVTNLKSEKQLNDNSSTNQDSNTYLSIRSISLEPKETWTKYILLEDYLHVKDSKNIRIVKIKGFFYPAPHSSLNIRVPSSNMYSLTIAPNDNNLISPIITPTEKKLKILPKEIVYLALSAEYVQDWPNFFKYVSLPDLIYSYADLHHDYEVKNKHVTIQKFKKLLINSKERSLEYFEILPDMQMSNKNNALVKAKVIRKIDNYEQTFHNTYSLKKFGLLWKITRVESSLIE